MNTSLLSDVRIIMDIFSHDVLPIAMGARLEDYEVAAPHKSFLHVDQFSGPRQLAKFLHKLDRDEDLYNEYFKVSWSLFYRCEDRLSEVQSSPGARIVEDLSESGSCE